MPASAKILRMNGHFRSVYVTGTDTGIGKTASSCALLHALRARGLRAVGMKPLASGSERTPAGWRNEDALALQAASDPQPGYDDVNPFALPNPLAPQAETFVQEKRLGTAHARAVELRLGKG